MADAQLGRVMALWSLAFIGTRPFAALFDGFLADRFGVRVAGVMMSLPVLVTAVWVHRLIGRGGGAADGVTRGDAGEAVRPVADLGGEVEQAVLAGRLDRPGHHHRGGASRS